MEAKGNIFNIQDRMQDLLESGLWTDVGFAFSTNQNEPEKKESVRAHKLVLGSASDVFEKMFFGSLPENTEKDIEIKGVPFDIFKKMLKYIYTNVVDLDDWQNGIELFYAANRFMLHALENFCVDFLIENLTTENVLEIYEFAVLRESPKLSAAALELISSKTIAVFRSEFFSKIKIDTLAEIVKQDVLQITEAELFAAVESIALKRGAIKNSKRVQDAPPEHTDLYVEFRKIVEQIRFQTMSVEAFTESAGFSAFLTADEVVAITACIVNPTLIGSVYPKDFIQNKRSFPFPQVFFDIVYDGNALGRIIFELRTDVVPKSAGRFYDNCVGKFQGYKGSKFSTINNSWCGGKAIDFKSKATLPETFSTPENFILKHTVAGTLGFCRDSHTHKSCDHYFSLTYEKASQYDDISVVIGQVVNGLDVLEKIKASKEKDVIIENCGAI